MLQTRKGKDKIVPVFN